MGKERRRRWRKIGKWRGSNRTPTTIHHLSDDDLELVLLGLDSPVCLVRAACTCRRWRRVVADADGTSAFLRRFRSLHAPPAVGRFHYTADAEPCSFGRRHRWPKVDPVFVPEPSASAGAGADGRRLSLDFVPFAGGRRELVDSRGSLLLLLHDKLGPGVRDCRSYRRGNDVVADLVVCEPVTQRYRVVKIGEACILSVFLQDGDADDDKDGGTIGMENFRVIVVYYDHAHYSEGYPYASEFTCGSNCDGWRGGVINDDGVCLPPLDRVHLAGRTGGRIYWGCKDGQVMVMDEGTLEFSAMALPDHMRWRFDANNFRIIGGVGGSLRIVRVTDDGDLQIFSHAHGCCGDDDWVLETGADLGLFTGTNLRLAEASRGLHNHKEEYFSRPAKIIRVVDGVVVLSPHKKAWLFSVDIESMELKRVRRRNR
ncbi:hypothetical protein ACP70R_003874 [Stipagrostis hirtigluma subsp. patula]